VTTGTEGRKESEAAGEKVTGIARRSRCSLCRKCAAMCFADKHQCSSVFTRLGGARRSRIRGSNSSARGHRPACVASRTPSPPRKANLVRVSTGFNRSCSSMHGQKHAISRDECQESVMAPLLALCSPAPVRRQLASNPCYPLVSSSRPNAAPHSGQRGLVNPLSE